MECFGTTDFDNNSRLITLSATTISGLHCINISTNNVHLCTAGHRYKQENTNLMLKRDTSALFPYSQADARVDSIANQI